MALSRKWNDISPRNRKLLLAAGAAEGSLKLAALVDLKRRPTDQVRGPKWAWATTIVVVNSFGAAPLTYFAVGRRR